MSFFSEAITAVGAIGLAFGAADMIRHYYPNSYRLLTAVLIVGTADAFVPQFSILDPGFITGMVAATAFGVWFLRRGRVVRQDGTIDNG